MKAVVVIILYAIIVSCTISHADSPADWEPFFQSYVKKGRTVCLAIVVWEITDKEKYGLNNRYSIVREGDELTIIFDDRKFAEVEILAEAYWQPADRDVYFIGIQDSCVKDKVNKVAYHLFPEKFNGEFEAGEIGPTDTISSIDIEFDEGDDTCYQENICNQLDIEGFILAFEKSEDDESEEDEESGCGCDVSGRATSFPLALFMFAIGIAAWAISRRARKK